MNSVAKKHPRSRSWFTSRLVLLAGLLAGLPVFGQATFTAGSVTTFNDATADPGNPANVLPGRSSPYGADNKVEIKETVNGKKIQGAVQKIAIVLQNLSHSYLADLDILVRGPGNKTVVLMSDVAINQGIGAPGAFLTFAQSGSELPAGNPPNDPAVATGTYRPTDRVQFGEAADAFGADVAPTGDNLNAFVNSDAKNTTWNLFALDDRLRDDGSMGPWQVLVWFDPVISMTNEVAGVSTINMVEDTPYLHALVIEDTDNTSAAFNAAGRIVITAPTIVVDGKVVPDESLFDKDKGEGWDIINPTGDGTTWVIKLMPKANAFNVAGQELTVTVKDGFADSRFVQKKILAKVVPANDAPAIVDPFVKGPNPAGGFDSTNFVRVAQGSISRSYQLFVADVDGAADVAGLKGSGTSLDSSIVNDHDIFFGNEAGSPKTFTIAPRGAATGTADFDIFVTDPAPGSAKSGPRRVSVVVSPATDRHVVANPTAVPLPDNAVNASTSDIDVSGLPAGKITRVDVVLANVNHAAPDDTVVVLEGPNGRRVTLMRGAGGAIPVVGGRITFSDLAVGNVPNAAAIITSIVGNSYKPTDLIGGNIGRGIPTTNFKATLAEAFADPAAPIDGNGKWRLYAVDTDATTAGEIKSGFVLQIWTRPVITGAPASTLEFNEEGGAQNFGITAIDYDGTIKSFSIDPASSLTLVSAKIDGLPTLPTKSASGTLVIQPKGHAYGSGKVIVQATDNLDQVTKVEITFNIKAINDAPTITPINKEIVYIGQPAGPITFQVNEVSPAPFAETDPNNLVVTAVTDNLKLLPPQNIFLDKDPSDPTGVTRRITMYPAGQESGTVNITITVEDTGQKNDTTGLVPDAATKLSRSVVLRLDVKGAPSPQLHGGLIAINDSGVPATVAKASPYGTAAALVEFKNVTGLIRKTIVNLVDIDAKFPNDMDVVLVSPAGRAVKIMSDVGGAIKRENIQLVIRDDATASLEAGVLASGTFKPTDIDGGDTDALPDVAAPTYFPTLSTAFNGQAVNGIWRLYVVDDTGNTKDNDGIGSWVLTFETDPNLATISDQETPEDTAKELSIDLGDDQPGVPTIILLEDVLAGGLGPLVKSYSTTGEGKIRRMSIVPATNQPEVAKDMTRRLKLTIKMGDFGVIGAVIKESSKEFNLKVTQVNDAPVISDIKDQTVPAGTILGPIPFTVTDIETLPANLTLSASSGSPALLPNANIIVAQDPAFPGDPTKKILTVLPSRATLVENVTITVSALDKETSVDAKDSKVGTDSFVYNAAGVGSLVFDSKGAPITFRDNATADPYPSQITVSGIDGLIGRIRVSLHGFYHDHPDDVNVVLVSPDGKRKSILMANAGGGAPLNSIPATAPLVLEFDQSAATAIFDGIGAEPNGGKLVTGRWKPGRYDPLGVLIPGLGPISEINPSLGAFTGLSPIGTWSLYGVDDTFGEVGAIGGGWSMAFETSPTVLALGSPSTDEDVPLTLTLTLLDTDSVKTPKDITVAVVSQDPTKIANNAESIKITGDTMTRTLKLTPVANANGKVKLNVILFDGKFTTETAFEVDIKAVDDPPTIKSLDGVGTAVASGGTGIPAKVTVDEDADFKDVRFEVQDVDSSLKLVDAFIRSNSESIVANLAANFATNGPVTIDTNVVGIITAKIKPNANAFGAAALQFGIKDSTSTTISNLVFEVTSRNDFPTITEVKGLETLAPGDAARANFEVFAGQQFPPVNVTVFDVETALKELVLTATSGAANQDVIPDALIGIVESGGQRTITVRTVGSVGRAGEIPITLTVKDGNNDLATEVYNVKVNNAPGTEESTARVFSNLTPITISDRTATGGPAKANPYPSVITIPAGTLKGRVHKVSVVLDNYSHSSPDDVDVLLEAPNGNVMILMSDAGGFSPVNNLVLEFNDGGTDMRDDGPLGSGRFKSRNFDVTPDIWVDKSPGNFLTLADAFKGSNPNGDWKLYVLDDANNGSGTIANGYTLRIVTTPWISAPQSLLTFTEDPDQYPVGGANQTVLTFGDDDPTVLTTFKITTASKDINTIPLSGIGVPVLSGGLLTLTPARDAFDETEKFTVELTITRVVAEGVEAPKMSISVTSKILARNDDPVISRLNDRTVQDGSSIIIPVQITDPDVPLDAIKLEVTSANQDQVPNSNIRISGGGNLSDPVGSRTLDVTITPKAGTTDAGNYSINITFTATDKSTLANHPGGDRIGVNILKLNVVQKNDPPVIADIAAQEATAGKAKSFAVKFTDPDDNDEFKLTAKSDRQDLIKDGSISITKPAGCTDVVGAGGLGCDGDANPWTVTFTPELGVEGTAVLTLQAKDSSEGVGEKKVSVTVGPSRERKFTNKDGKITINDFGTSVAKASPYPSVIATDELVGDVSDVRVELTAFKHNYPDDVDILLVSPNGTKVVLMSDAGGSTKADGIAITFADGQPPIPDLGPLSSTFYKPANYEGSDTFPDPVTANAFIAGPFETDITKFVGTPAKGEWKLYVVDDTRGDAGEIAGWSLYITTRPRIEFVGTANQTLTEDTPVTVYFNVIEEKFTNTTGYDFTSVSSALLIMPSDTTGKTFGPAADQSIAQYQMVGVPVKDAFGAAEITINAKNKPFGQTVSGKFTVTYTGINDAPFITRVANQNISSGALSAPIDFDYGDAETPKKDLVFEKESSDTSVVPISGLVFEGNTLRIAPLGSATGKSEITLRVKEPGANPQVAETKFTVIVNRALNSQFASTSEIVIRDNNTAGTYPAKLSVAGVKGTTSRVSVTLAGLVHSYPADLDVLLVGPNRKGTILMSDVGGGQGVTGVWLTFEDSRTGATRNPVPYNPNTPIASGSYRPTNEEGVNDTFASDGAGGPVGSPYSADLSVFKGIDPNGEWKLYIVDDINPDGGRLIAGWVLNLYTAEPVIGAVPDQITDENVPITVQFEVADDDTALSSVITTASGDAPNVFTVGPVVGTGSVRSITITPKAFASGTGRVSLAATDASNASSTSFNVTVVPVNQAPTITGLPATTSTPANRTKTLPFTVADEETAAADLAVTVSVLDTGFGSADVASGGSSRILSFRPTGARGTTSIEVRVSDGTVTTKSTISVEIGAPYVLTVASIPDQVMVEDNSKAVSVGVSGSDTSNVKLEAVSADPTKIAKIEISGAGATWLLNLIPAQDATGSTKVTVTASDEFGTGSTTFNVDIAELNDPPTIGLIPDQQTQRDISAQVSLDVADKDSALSALKYTWSASNPVLVKNVLFNLTADNRVVATVFPGDGQVGQASLTVFVDDGTTKVSRPFLLSVVAPPNAAPVFAVVPDQTTIVNIPLVVPLSITDPDTDPAKMVFTSGNSNPQVVRSILFGLSGATVNATIRPQPNVTGTAAVTINVQDGDNRVSRTFVFTVNPTPNEPSVVGPISDQVTTQNKAVDVAVSVTDPDTQFGDLVFGALASNPFLLDVEIVKVGEAVTLKLTPKLDATGVSTITFSVNDGKSTVERVFSFGVSAAPLPKMSLPVVTTNPDGTRTITITWTDGGELEVADGPLGPWTKTGNRTGTFSGSAAVGSKFYRVSRGQ